MNTKNRTAIRNALQQISNAVLVIANQLADDEELHRTKNSTAHLHTPEVKARAQESKLEKKRRQLQEQLEAVEEQLTTPRVVNGRFVGTSGAES